MSFNYLQHLLLIALSAARWLGRFLHAATQAVSGIKKAFGTTRLLRCDDLLILFCLRHKIGSSVSRLKTTLRGGDTKFGSRFDKFG